MHVIGLTARASLLQVHRHAALHPADPLYVYPAWNIAHAADEAPAACARPAPQINDRRRARRMRSTLAQTKDTAWELMLPNLPNL